MITRMLAEAWRLTTAVAADPVAALLLLVYGLVMTVVMAVAWHYVCRALIFCDRWRQSRRARRADVGRIAEAVPADDEQWERLADLEEIWKLPAARLNRTARTRNRLRAVLRRARTHARI